MSEMYRSLEMEKPSNFLKGLVALSGTCWIRTSDLLPVIPTKGGTKPNS